jgi:hypothetical protein
MQPAAFDVLRTQAAEAIAPLVGPDSDGDDVPDHLDNCSAIANPAQEDTDVNGTGDLCNSGEDTDGDEFADNLDNCPLDPNPDQTDTDANGTGDLCNSAEDTDDDEFADALDNCPSTWNPTQELICVGDSVPALTPTGIVVLVLALVGFGAYGPPPYSLFYTGQRRLRLRGLKAPKRSQR